MELKKNVIAAISSAITAYIQEEEALLALQQKRLAEIPRAAYSPYAMAGRTAAMNARWMWQMRLVK
ncbi:MAG: hypothetical protein GX422_15080 [Deltaproteobacteria bacterium]|jgi:hypothetical protein|nr:hypothetical protein [Deltaproteobacteria bacterium]